MKYPKKKLTPIWPVNYYSIYYNIGAVIGILTFIILAVGALLTYRNSKSYKEGGI